MTVEHIVADKLAEYFKDPVDKKCPYCKAAKDIIPLIRADERTRVTQARQPWEDAIRINERKQIYAFLVDLQKHGHLNRATIEYMMERLQKGEAVK